MKGYLDNPDLKVLITACELQARSQGWTGGSTYQLTREDCDWITRRMGRKPTLSEWLASGYRWVGSRHVNAPEED